MSKFLKTALFVSTACISLSVSSQQPTPYYSYSPPPPEKSSGMSAASVVSTAGVALPAEDLISVNYNAVDTLVSRLKSKLPPVDSAECQTDCRPSQNLLIVATIVDINQLESTSTLGRLISEHVLGRLSQHGYGGIELKVRENVYLKRDSGEFLLTRELRDSARKHNAHAVVVGTYTEAPDRVFVSIKVAEVESNRVIGAVDYVLAKNDLVRHLLASKS